jgi:hypothetical protein
MGTTPQEILRRHVMDPVPPLRGHPRFERLVAGK